LFKKEWGPKVVGGCFADAKQSSQHHALGLRFRKHTKNILFLGV